MPHRPAKSILGLAGAAVWMVSGCAATPPSFAPQISELIASEHATRDYAWHHQTGVAHLKAARYGLAVFELRKALRENPRSIETLNAIAIAYDHLGRFDQSRGYYDRAFALDPGDVQTLNNLGRSAALQGDPAAATAWLERAQRLDPGAREVAENLADARMQAAPALAASPPPVPARTTPDEPLRQSVRQPVREPVRQPIRAWVERTDRLHQTLVTTAPFEIVQTLAALDLRPEVINVAGLPDLSLHNRPASLAIPAGSPATTSPVASSPVRLEI
jgi:tetratricopeptide (TPR) repeat protein